MALDLVDLFPKTVGVSQLQSLTPEVIAKAKELIDIGSDYHIPGDGGFTHEQQLLNKAVFREVKQEILGLCREFADAHSHIVEDIAICNSWGNVVNHGDIIRHHSHTNSYISGSFYLTEGSAFNIINDEFHLQFGFSPAIRGADQNYRSMESFNINPKPGRIVLFPSNLRHMV
ncbi:MAG: 2OG-Fe(II) oxygenase family protein, partial [Pseudomonadales bacterium]|nr:2OG-Fe(II) oxygenase family protein [Pseudomonadales bacterium]